MFLDMILNYNQTKEIVDQLGWDELMKRLKNKYPEYNLFQVSTDWYHDKRFIMKAKGYYGDVIVGWSEDELAEAL